MTKEELLVSLRARGLEIDECKLNKLIDLMHSTLETNKLFNLTAITDEDSFIEKMIFDSALAMVNNDFSNKKIIDIGTGAGYPGMVLYILNPEGNFTLLDSTKKKIDYLTEYSTSKNYQINFVNDRCEEYSTKHIEEYDYAIARAVAPLNILLELIIPLLKVGGTFIAMKGPGSEKEINECGSAFKKLGCHLAKIYSDQLPSSKEERNIIYITKDKKTSDKYPRSYADIKKKPL